MLIAIGIGRSTVYFTTRLGGNLISRASHHGISVLNFGFTPVLRLPVPDNGVRSASQPIQIVAKPQERKGIIRFPQPDKMAVWLSSSGQVTGSDL